MTQTLKIILAGTEYPVPQLVWKKLRKVVPLFYDLRKMIETGAQLTESVLETMGKIVYEAITADLTYEQFEELPITEAEISDAVTVVAMQAGMQKGDGAQGESASSTLIS